MDAKPKGPKGRTVALSSLNVAIEALNLAKEISGIAPAKAAFGSVSVLLTMMRDSMVNEQDYIELGLACADVCRALDRGMNGKKLDDFGQSVCEAINQLVMTVAEIQKKVIKQSGRNAVSRLIHAKNDQGTIASWKLDLNRILHVFNTELVVNTHVTVSEIRHDVSKIREEIGGQVRSAQNSARLGESPPPPPRACFGRDELINEIVGLAENLTPIALIGTGGIGKTSVSLTVLHNDRIEKRFGENRWFIRCDQFPATLAHFLRRLSKVIGASVENPEGITPLRPFLSSKEMFIILDNAESILDPQGIDAQKIYAVMEELSQFKTVCLCVTSRIATVPRYCKRPIIPTLSMEAACNIFYGIYDDGGRSDVISDLLQRLDFHALTITLLATVASHNMWSYDRLAREWGAYRTQVLQTDFNESLAASIELSLASPTFRKFGPGARDLLGVVAFFPQGVDENNIEWLFHNIPERTKVFDGFCVLSLTYRSNGFVTMLAPLREYLRSKDPRSSPLLRTTKECYLTRLSVRVDPDEPGFKDAQWITLEDVNVEHLLDVFTSIDTDSVDIWAACARFIQHLCWHKRRMVTLGPKIEGLPDDHPSKPECLFHLSWLFDLVGNHVESKRLLVHTLRLYRERGDDFEVAQTLRHLADTNRRLEFYREGIAQVKEALEIYGRLNDILGQARSLHRLARLLYHDKQLDAAEEAASRAVFLLDGEDQYPVCLCYRVLGQIFHSKDETDKAIKHFEKALGVASLFNWHGQVFWNHHSLAELHSNEGKFDDAHAHIARAKTHAINDPYLLGRAMELEARFWYKESRPEEARSEASCAADIYEKIGAAKGMEDCRVLLQLIEEKIQKSVTPGESYFDACGTE